MKNKSWQLIWLIFFICLLLPFRWLFWLNWRRLNYLSFTFSLSDAWLVFFFFYFLLFHKKNALLISGGFLISWLISKGNFLNWLRVWPILRIVSLTIISYFLIQKNKQRRYFYIEKLLFLLATLTILEFLLKNLIYHQGAFKVYLATNPVYLSQLFYPHPNVLAFIGLSLFWLSSNAPTKKLLRVLATTAILVFSGSVSGSFLFLIWLVLFENNLSPLGIISLFLSLLLTNLNNITVHFQWLFNPQPSYLNPLWPAIKFKGSQANWSLQPIHNSFLLIKTSLGWPLFLLGLGLLGWLLVNKSKQKRLIILSICLWAIIDHFFLTTINGQNLTAYLLAFLL